MNYLPTKVLLLTILLLAFFQMATAQDCTLSSPQLNIIETTEHTISLEWEPVEGAVTYQLNLYLAESQELIQQIQTEITSYTFNDLASNIFYDIGLQSGCSHQSYNPVDDENRTRTQGGLVIIVDDLRIEEGDCEGEVSAIDRRFPSSTSYTPIAPISSNSGLYLDVTIRRQSVLFGERFEIVVLPNPLPTSPQNYVIDVFLAYHNRIQIDQANNIWMNEAPNPHIWWLIGSLSNNTTSPGNELQIRWHQEVDVTYTNCVSYNSITVIENLTDPIGDDDDSGNPARTSQNTPGEHATATTTKQSSTTTASPVAYPNPVADRLTIELPTQGGSVQIMDINGKVWHQVNTQDLRLTVDMNNWPTGTYILRYDDGKMPHIQRVIKL